MPSKQETYINSQKKYHHVRKKPISKEQKNIIIGLMLGGAIMTHSKLKRIKYDNQQLLYLEWIKDSLGNIFPNNVKYYTDHSYNISSICHQDFNQIHNLFFDNTKKIIKKELINYVDELALAVWFMSSGSSKHDRFGINYCSKFSTEGFTYEENIILQDILYIKFGIASKVCEYQKHGKKYNYISVNKKNSIKLTKVIEKYIHPCMVYKLVYDRSPTTKC